MSYNELPMMHKTLIQWKYHLKYGYELKEFNIQEHPNQTATITISCFINVHNGITHKVSIPNRTFATTLADLIDINASDKSRKLANWLNAFDTDIYEQAKFILDKAEGEIR